MFNLPNLLTLLRIGAIPVFLILLTNKQYTEALLVFIGAAVTDSLDGMIARLTNSHTAFGAYIDPLADKLLLVSSFAILAFLEFIPRWLAVLVISRDMIILLGFLTLFVITGRSIAIQPSLVGKASTFFQFFTVTMTLVSLHNPNWRFAWLWNSILFLAGGATTVSGLQYLVRAFQWASMQENELPGNTLNGTRAEAGKDETRHSA